jgi:hypothetical protein
MLFITSINDVEEGKLLMKNILILYCELFNFYKP